MNLQSYETNSAQKSTGMVKMMGFEFEGNLFLIPCGGLAIAIVMLAMSGSVLVSAVPFAISVAYAWFFYMGKPPHYREDYLEYIESLMKYGKYGYQIKPTAKTHPISVIKE